MGRVLAVTGGSRGIGFGIAKRFAEDGYQVAILDINAEADYRFNLNILDEMGADWFYLQGDTRIREDREQFVSEIVARFGRIDVLVNNAGVAPKVRTDVLDMTEESFDYVVGTNLKGTMFMTQIVAKQMLRQEWTGVKRGTIVNIGSASATVSSSNRCEYCVSKAGVMMLTSVYAERLAAEGIMVHEIRPGVIDTDMTKVVHEKYTRLIAEGQFPIARWGTPEDVASVVSVVCDDRYIYTTGNYIDVDGGFHIRKL
ncbi:MAG: 3-ketoacyl-ACP reductase [Oscillospiraceae bacterium]|nr:3-ketoacyl-ACP reductase [Oscillospiraceae bacterium]